MQHHIPAVGVLTIAALLTGCQDPHDAAVEYESVRLTLRDADERDMLWETALDVLRRQRFRVDRNDKNLGVMTTYPEVSGHWFEFWRQDTVTPYDFAEANLHTIRREATVNLTPDEGARTWVLAVKVTKARQSVPERQISNPAAGLRVFSEAVPTTGGDLVRRAEAVHWIELGRDPALEQRLLRRIVDLFEPDRLEFIPEPAEPALMPLASAPPGP